MPDELAPTTIVSGRRSTVADAIDLKPSTVQLRSGASGGDIVLPTGVSHDLDPPPAPGTTAKVVFDADAQGGTAGNAPLRIPASAIAQRGELSAVYVKQGDRLLLRQLRLGARVGDSVEVISGLQAGDLVARDPVAATQALAAQRKAADGRHD